MALTAFVVIALHHGLAVFQDKNAEQLKQRVVRAPVCLPSAGPSWPPFSSGAQLSSPQTFLLPFS